MLSHLAPSIMIIDSNATTRKAASSSLERSGFNVIKMSDADEALSSLESTSAHGNPHIIVIAESLEGMSCLNLCSKLKSNKALSSIPILILADNEKTVSAAKILEHGFDGFLVKPFIHDNLISKVKLLLSKTRPVLQSKTLRFQDIEVDLSSYKVTKNGIEIHLGPTEFKILQCLIENPHKIFSRQDIMHYVWQSKDNVEARTIDVHINRLRTALRHPYETADVITTVRAKGYCLELSGN